MQILLGAHETIIKINSKTVSIDYIRHFISTHFPNSIITKNTIYIPQSFDVSHHRSFLLKWIYTLYAKKTKQHSSEFKERLIFRNQKAIKIILPEKIISKISYALINSQKISIKIQPNNHKIAQLIKSYLNVKLTIMPTHLECHIHTDQEKERLQKLMYSKDLIKIPHRHLFNSFTFKDFFKPEEITTPKPIIKTPYDILGLSQYDSLLHIKKRYKTLAKKYHPDMVCQSNEYLIKSHTALFQEILEAYSKLLLLHT